MIARIWFFIFTVFALVPGIVRGQCDPDGVWLERQAYTSSNSILIGQTGCVKGGVVISPLQVSNDTIRLVGGGTIGYVLTWNGTAWVAAATDRQTISAGDGSGSDKTIALSDGGGAVVLRPGSNVTLSRTADTITISATPGAGSTDLTYSGTSSPVTLNSSTGTDVSTTAGTGISLSATSTNLTITNTAPDQVVSITGAGINNVTGTYPNFTITGTEVDGSVSNELQTIANTSDATSHTATLSNSGGSVQIIEGTGIGLATGGTGLNGTVTVTNTAPDQTVSITGGGINAVTGSYPNFTVTGTEVDGSVTNEGSLSVGAGGANTSTIASNTSGSTPVTVSGSNTVLITESGSTITVQADTSLLATVNDLNNVQGRTDSTFAKTDGTYTNKRITSNVYRNGTTGFRTTDTIGILNILAQAHPKAGIYSRYTDATANGFLFFQLDPDGQTNNSSVGNFNFWGTNFDGVNSPYSSRANHVWRFGYNTSAGGARVVTTDADLHIAFESNFYNVYSTGRRKRAWEWHLQSQDTLGGVHRAISVGGSHDGKDGEIYMQANRFSIKPYSDASRNWLDFDYISRSGYIDSMSLYWTDPQIGLPFLSFRNAANSAYIRMFQADASNRLVVNPDGNDVYTYAPNLIFNTLGTITTNDANPVQIGNSTLKSFLSIYAPSTEVYRLRSTTGGTNLWSTYVNSDNIVYGLPGGGAYAQFYTNSAQIIGANSRIGIGVSPQQTLHVGGTFRVNTLTGTPTILPGLNASGDLGQITVGSGLSLSAGTLSVTSTGVTGSGTANQVTYWNGTSSIAGDAGWTFDATNNTQTIDNQVIANNQNANKAILGAPAALTNYPGLWLTNAAISASNAAVLGEISSNTTIINAPSTGKLSFRVNNSEIFRAKSPGISIATGADPVSQLDVEGGVVIGASYAGTNSPATNGALIQGSVSIGTTSNAGRVHVAGPGATSSTFSGVFQNSSAQNVLTIRDDRTVGINTSAQVRAFEVAGEVRITDLATDTPTRIVGADADGDLDDIALTDELAITSGALGTNFSTTITPAQITANQTTYNPTGAATAWIWRISADDALRIIRSITAPAFNKRITIHNVGSNTILFTHQDNLATAGNRFDFGRDYPLFPGRSMEIQYDVTTARWRLVSPGHFDNLEHVYFNERLNAPLSGISGDYSWWEISSTGTVGGVTPVPGRMAGISVNTGSSATGSGYVASKDVFFENSNSAGSANWAYFKAIIKTPASLSSSGEDYTLRVGFAAGTIGGGAVDGAFFDYNHNNVSANWGCNTTNAGNTQRNNSGITVATSTTYLLEIALRPDLTAEFYINGTRVATNDTFVPMGTSDDMLVTAEIEKSVGTGQRDLQVFTIQTSIAFVK